jgi:autotransporter passenger strand-loop-strand repeat protein
VIYGEQDVYGSADSAAIDLGGSQIVERWFGDQHRSLAARRSSRVAATRPARLNFGGSQVVEDGGAAANTDLEGGTEIVSAGGTDVSATINGGEQHVWAAPIRRQSALALRSSKTAVRRLIHRSMAARR